MTTLDKAWVDEAAEIDPCAWDRLRSIRDADLMGAEVRALSYRVPVRLIANGCAFVYSISGWRGAV